MTSRPKRSKNKRFLELAKLYFALLLKKQNVGAIMKFLMSLIILSIAACHPFSPFLPPKLSVNQPLHWQAKQSAPPSTVNITYDSMGIPHIFGENDRAIAYGLGFAQARDRLFQIDMMRKAAQGRASELFGERALASDRKLRILAFNLHEQYAALNTNDKEILQSFSDGVNEGARHAGKSVEHFLLRIDFAPFEPYEALAISRLQAWDLAQNLDFELAKEEALQLVGADNKVFQALIKNVPDRNVPIVAATKKPHKSVQILPLAAFANMTNASASKNNNFENQAAQNSQHMFVPPKGGGSNSWVVSGEKTVSGKAVLCNDPHLNHRAPSTFYLAHLKSPQFSAVGATLPGVPAIVIGHSQYVAWGVTASFADVQDLLELKEQKYSTKKQQFLDKNGKVLLEEEWLYTESGPVLPPSYESTKKYALQWPAFYAGGLNKSPVDGFFKLMKAHNVKQAMAAADNLSLASINMVFADIKGDISYKLISALPARAKNKNKQLPWQGVLEPAFLPTVQNPKSGIIVAANQRVVGDDHELLNFVGGFGAPPHRAIRINERLQEMTAGKNKADADELLSIQQDVISVEARKLAPILGKYCPKEVAGYSQEQVREFCQEVAAFTGNYEAQATGALPYTLLLHDLKMFVYEYHFGERIADRLDLQANAVMLLEDSLLEYNAGKIPPLFVGKQGEDIFVELLSKAAQQSLDFLHKNGTSKPASWHWANAHVLQAKGPLSALPLIGSLFSSEAVAQSGQGKTPRAEGGLPGAPVKTGAVFRMVAEMSSPPQVKMVLDGGNSGHPASPHFQDQFQRWHRGDLLSIPVDEESININAAGKITLLATVDTKSQQQL